MNQRLVNLTLVCLASLCSLLVMEVGLRSYDALRGFGFFSDRRNILAQPIRPILPFRTYGVNLYKEHNGARYISSSHGELYPLEKPNGTFRIVCFGGSTTYNQQSFKEYGVHYPLSLQSLLRERLQTDKIEVINVGYPSYATPHSLILLELDVLSWDPDLVIMSHNANDQSTMYWPHFTPDYSHKYSNPMYTVPPYKARFTTLNVLFQHSQLYWVIKDRLEGIKTPNPDYRLRRRSYGPKPHKEAIGVFERNLRSFIALAETNGIEVLLATQPLQPSKEVFDIRYANKAYNQIIMWPLHDEFVRHHSAYNKTIEKVAKENDVLFLDHNKLFGGKAELFTDPFHYTSQGIEKLAHDYAAFLISTGLVKSGEAQLVDEHR